MAFLGGNAWRFRAAGRQLLLRRTHRDSHGVHWASHRSRYACASWRAARFADNDGFAVARPAPQEFDESRQIVNDAAGHVYWIPHRAAYFPLSAQSAGDSEEE